MLALSEKNASWIAFFISLIGVLSIIFLVFFAKPPIVRISEISSMAGSNGIFEVHCRIASSKLSKNALYLRLFDGNSLNAVIYNPSESQLSLASKNSMVSAVGSLSKRSNYFVFEISRLARD